MDQHSTIIRCSRCGTRNRVPTGRLGEGPVCGRCRAPLGVGQGPGKPVEVTDQSFSQAVLSAQEPVLLDCWAPWCGPCRTVAPILEDLARDFGGRFTVAKLNVDENPGTAGRYGVRSIPTLLIFKQGREVDRLVGAMPKEAIRARMEAHL